MPPWDTLPLEQSPAAATQRRFVGQCGERPAENERAEAAESGVWDLYAPSRWGLSAEAISTVGARLYEFWLRFRGCFKTSTRDTSGGANAYLVGHLPLAGARGLATM